MMVMFILLSAVPATDNFVLQNCQAMLRSIHTHPARARPGSSHLFCACAFYFVHVQNEWLEPDRARADVCEKSFRLFH